MGNSLREILNRYAEGSQTTYIEDFLRSEDYTCEYIKEALENKMLDAGVLSYTPEEIAANCSAVADLEELIHTYIKLLPFTERLDAIKEFNDLFSKGNCVEGYQLYSLRRFKDKNKPVGGENYCRTEDLLDGVEIEILLLKRLQKGELELLLNADENVNAENARNTQDRLAKDFCMSRPAIKRHIHKLKYTHNLLGYDPNVNLHERPIEYDGTTVHPVFLALNPSEAVLLTVWLKDRFPKKENLLDKQAATIADEIFMQLSNHGKQIVQEKAEDVGIVFEENISPRDNVPQHRLENYKNDIGICYKRNMHCKIRLRQDADKEYEGYLGSRDGYTFEFRDKQGNPIFAEANGTPKKLREADILSFNVI